MRGSFCESFPTLRKRPQGLASWARRMTGKQAKNVGLSRNLRGTVIALTEVWIEAAWKVRPQSEIRKKETES